MKKAARTRRNMSRNLNKKSDQRLSNIADIEEKRAYSRETKLYWKRFGSHIMIQDHLDRALSNPQLRQDLYNSIPGINAHLLCGNKELEFSAIKKICFLLNVEEPPIEEVIRNGIVPHLRRIMTNNQDQGYVLNCNAAFALRQILNGSPAQANVVLDHGGVQSFATLLSSEFDALKFEAVKAVERVASLSVEYRNALLDAGVATQLANMVEQVLGPPIVHHYTIIAPLASALRWLCSWDTVPTLDQVGTVVLNLKRLINFNTGFNFLEVVNNACIALRFLSRGSAEHMNAIVDPQLCQRLVFLLNVPSSMIIDSVLSFMGRIFSTDPNLQIMIDSGVFARLHQFLTVRQMGCNIISGLISGGRHRLQLVLGANLIQPLLDIAEDQTMLVETRHEAIFTLANAARRGSFEQIGNMMNQGCLRPISDHINSVERLRYMCVEGAWNILRMGEANKINGVNPFVQLFRNLNGFIRLEMLRNDAQLGDKSRLMLAKYNQL